MIFFDHVEIYETGDALFIPEGEAHKHRAKSEDVLYFAGNPHTSLH